MADSVFITNRPPTRPLRHLIAFIISLCQAFGGLAILSCTTATYITNQQPKNPPYYCSISNLIPLGYSFGFLHLVSGIFGAIAFLPLRRSYDVSGRLQVSSASPVYIVIALMAALPFAFDNFYCTKGLHWLEVLLIVEVNLGHVLSAVGVGFALPDLCTWVQASSPHPPGAIQAVGAPVTGIVVKSANSVPSSPNSGSVMGASTSPRSSRSKSASAFQLPEVRSHVQQSSESGEKVTVVTLPEAEGVVYAVPEENYVICRSRGAYVAPASNPKLTQFFPSYTKVQAE